MGHQDTEHGDLAYTIASVAFLLSRSILKGSALTSAISIDKYQGRETMSRPIDIMGFVLLAIMLLPLHTATAAGEVCRDSTNRQIRACGPGEMCFGKYCTKPTVHVQQCRRDSQCSTGFCFQGFCVEPCNHNNECRANETCNSGVCFPGEGACRNDSWCGDRQVCERGRCQDVSCTEDAHCGQRAVCRNNNCRRVQCTQNAHCRGAGYYCDTRNQCVSRCPQGQKWVQGTGIPTCGGCVPVKARAQCRSIGDCPVGKSCAQGHCIEACNQSRMGVPSRGSRLLDDPARYRGKVPTPPVPVPDPMPVYKPGSGLSR